MTLTQYTCADCGKRFLSPRSEEEANAEYQQNWGMHIDEVPTCIICHECYLKSLCDDCREEKADEGS